MKLRPYQVEAVATCVENGIVELPTGTGKTVIFSDVVSNRKGLGQVLILAHRDELIQQAKEKLRIVGNGHVGVVKGDLNQIDAPVVLGSVQTLARENRLEQVVGRKFGTVIVDECHHSGADSYDRILSTFPDALKLGFTATPFRMDGKSLGKHFPKILYRKTLLQMIAEQYLCDLKAKRVRIKSLNLGVVKVSGGDYQDGALGEAMEQAGAPDQIVDAWIGEGEGRKSIAFLPTVRMAEAVTEGFRSRGIKAALVHGEMGIDERRGVIGGFAEDRFKILVNVAVLLEGYDQPDIACVIMARPTKSKVLYTQAIGRGTRKFPGKENCLILDLCGVTEDFDLQSMAVMLGITERSAEGGVQAMLEAAAKGASRIPQDGEPPVVELETIMTRPRLHWIKGEITNNYLLSLDTGMLLLLPASDVQGWNIRFLPKDRYSPAKLMWKGLEFGYAQGIAEDFVRTSGAWGLAMAGAKWRNEGPTVGQIAMLRKIGRYRDGLSKGEASDVISRFMAGKRI